MRGSLLSSIVLVLALIAVACGDSGSDAGGSDTDGGDGSPLEATAPGATALGTTGSGAGAVIAEGVFQLPAATSFDTPGFHETLVATHVLPEGIDPSTGRTLVVALRDVSRPDQDCSQEHPLSGCATVDWSDNEDRPNVPAGGVFDNRITLDLGSGRESLFLSESGELASSPNDFEPG